MTESPIRPRKRPFRFRTEAAQPGPMVAINTTPLIDMMLVLLIMFIVSIPLSTHELPLDLPPPGPERADQRPLHRLTIDAAGRTFWNGTRVDTIALRRQLAATARDPARPDLQLDAHGGARYEQVDQVLADIRRAGVTRLGIVFDRNFDRALG